MEEGRSLFDHRGHRFGVLSNELSTFNGHTELLEQADPWSGFMAFKPLLKSLHGGFIGRLHPRPETGFQQAVLNRLLTSDVQSNLAQRGLLDLHKPVILKTMTRPDSHRLVGPIARRQNAFEVPRTGGVAQLHGPQHAPLGVQQVGGIHEPPNATLALKSPLNQEPCGPFIPLRPTGQGRKMGR